MSLLDHLWDDTVAGPLPDSGLGKLRKKPSFGLRSSSGKESDVGGGMMTDETKRVTRSIMIVRPPGYQNNSASITPPVSPAGSTPPVSPFSGSRESFRFRRRSTSDAYQKANEVGTRSSPPYGM